MHEKMEFKKPINGFPPNGNWKKKRGLKRKKIGRKEVGIFFSTSNKIYLFLLLTLKKITTSFINNKRKEFYIREISSWRYRRNWENF